MQGPEIRTGFLKDGKPIQLKEGQEITVTTDYNIKGDEKMISMSYKKLPVDLKTGNTILCADGTITLTVLSCDPAAGTVRCRCENTAVLGERKNVNLPGVVVDLPTLTDKDKEDILEWGVPNNIDMIALSFVRKGSDLVNVRKVLGPHAKNIKLMSKVRLTTKFSLFLAMAFHDLVFISHKQLHMRTCTAECRYFMTQQYPCLFLGLSIAGLLIDF